MKTIDTLSRRQLFPLLGGAVALATVAPRSLSAERDAHVSQLDADERQGYNASQRAALGAVSVRGQLHQRRLSSIPN